MRVYYNENDERAAAWLRALIAEGVLPDGEIDTRSVVDVRPADLVGFRQCHFFAGIGGWAYALQLAGWPADREVWTGSCPCQPWSVAGKGKGADDPRHLWPTWQRLIAERRPATIIGEQTASEDGLYWLDLVYASMEACDYAIGAVNLPAASAGAPHGRQRLWFVAHDHRQGRDRVAPARLHADGQPGHDVDRCRLDGGLGDPAGLDGAGTSRDEARTGPPAQSRRKAQGRRHAQPRDAGHDGELADADGRRTGQRAATEPSGDRAHNGIPGPHRSPSFWASADWIPCIDGRARPVEPGTFPLAHGVPARVGRLRGYGNAIVPQVAAEVIAAYLEIHP